MRQNLFFFVYVPFITAVVAISIGFALAVQRNDYMQNAASATVLLIMIAPAVVRYNTSRALDGKPDLAGSVIASLVCMVFASVWYTAVI